MGLSKDDTQERVEITFNLVIASDERRRSLQCDCSRD